MKNFSRLLALLLALCLMGGCALAELPELPASEEAEVESESVAEDTAQEDTVLAVVNGENLMQSDVDSYAYYLLYLYYSQGFDITDPQLTASIQQAAIQGSVEQAVFFQKAKELGFDQFTAEEETQLQQDAQPHEGAGCQHDLHGDPREVEECRAEGGDQQTDRHPAKRPLHMTAKPFIGIELILVTLFKHQ